ncbi:MAG: NAD(P)H-dependent oxidoreductase subunit E [Woeseiaceae bacterium]
MSEKSFDPDVVSQIVTQHDGRAELLVQILHGVMEAIGWIPDDAIRQLASELNVSRADVHGVVSYYDDFRTAAPGKRVIKVCQAEACQAMGARELGAHIERSLGVAMHESTTAVTLQPVYCLGNCACSPAVMIDNKTYGRVTSQRFDELLESLAGER